MAQRKQARRIWVELEVQAQKEPAVQVKVPRWRYVLINPRTGAEIDIGFYAFGSAKDALNAGLSYLRRTYNTGKSK